MVKPSIRSSLAIVVGLSLTLAGCGGDDKDSSSAKVETLSAKDLRSKADAICKRVGQKSNDVDSPSELADMEGVALDLVKISADGVKDLEALVPSADDKATMTKLIGLIKTSNEHLTELSKQAKAGDEEQASTAAEASTDALTEFETVAKEAGFDDCGSIVSGSDTAVADDGTTDDGTADGTTDTTTPLTSSGFADIDLGPELNPIDGYEFETLPADARSELLATLGADEDVKSLVVAVGTTTVKNDAGVSLLIFLGINRELAADETQTLVDAITAGGTNVETGEVAGQQGWAYVSAEGQQGFVTIRSTTIVIGLSDSSEHLAGVISGLLQTNPDI